MEDKVSMSMSSVGRGAVIRLLLAVALGLSLSLAAVAGLSALAAEQSVALPAGPGVVRDGFGSSAVLPPTQTISAALEALAWLRTQQSVTGTIGGEYFSLEALYSLASHDERAADWRVSATAASLEGYITTIGARYSRSAGGASAGRFAVGIVGADACWPFGASTPLDFYSPITGTFASGSAFHAWGMLGTAALSQTVPGLATAFLEAQQQSNGGWEWTSGFGTDTNSTSLAIQALIAAGEPVTSTAVVSGLTYLRSAQNPDGGFPYDPNSPWPGGKDSDTNSTANVVQAVVAVGEDPMSGAWTTITGTHPISFLLSMQLPDGSFEWQRGLGANLSATEQAISALLYRYMPFRQAAAVRACPAALLPYVNK